MSTPISISEISKLPAVLDYLTFHTFITENDIFNLNQYTNKKMNSQKKYANNVKQIDYEYLYHNISDHHIVLSSNETKHNKSILKTSNDYAVTLKYSEYQLSRDRLIEYISSSDCYISYEWGYDSLRRNMKIRIASMSKYLLQQYNIICYSDDGQLNGMNLYSNIANPDDKIKHYIAKSQCILICLTTRYYTKLLSKNSNSIKYEFDLCMQMKESRYIILCIMEESARVIPIELQEKYPELVMKQKFDLINFDETSSLLTSTLPIPTTSSTSIASGSSSTSIATSTSGVKAADTATTAGLILVYEYIRSMITPLILGGPFQKETAVFNSTIIGRHYQWLIKHIPSLSHDACLSYATVLYNAKIESTMRLMQLFQYQESTYIANLLNIPNADIISIKNALRSDLSYNSDIYVCNEIAGIVNIKNKELTKHIESERWKQAKQIDQNIQSIEIDSMYVEDQLSYNLRDHSNHLINHQNFQKSRKEFIFSAQERQESVLDEINIANNEFQELLELKNMQWMNTIFKQISEIVEPEMISAALYKLYIKVDQNTSHVIESKLNLDCFTDPNTITNQFLSPHQNNKYKHTKALLSENNVNNNNIIFTPNTNSYSTSTPSSRLLEINPNTPWEHHDNKQAMAYNDGYYGISSILDNIQDKKSRIQRFIDNSYSIGEDVDVRKIFEKHLNRTSLSAEELEANQYHMLLLLMEEACYICKTIEIICKAAAPDDFTSNPMVIDRFLNTGVVKLLVTLLSKIYLFQCKFSNKAMPNNQYQGLSMPISALRAVRHLVKRGLGHWNIHEKLGYLFIEVGVIPLCIEIFRFHQENIDIVYQTLDLLYVLIDIPSLTDLVIGQFMKDVNNLVFLIIFMERYDTTSSSSSSISSSIDIPIPLVSTEVLSLGCILGILTYLIKSQNIRENLINIYRIYRMYHIYHMLLQNSTHLCDTELCSQLCQTINNIYFIEENSLQHSLLYTSEYTEEMRDYRQVMQSKINFQLVIHFMDQVLEKHWENHVMCSIVFIALGNLVFSNNAIKQEAYSQHIEKIIIKIMKSKMKLFDTNYHIMDNISTSYNANNGNNNSRSSYNTTTTTSNSNNNSRSSYQLELLKECIIETLLTCTNLIITPPYLPYDSLRTVQNCEIAAPAQNYNQLLAATVRDDDNNIVVTMITSGICELIMNILTHYMNEEKLLYSALLFVHKCIYRGRYISCCRFVSIGLCEQILVIMKYPLYENNLEINLLCTLIATDLLSAHPILLNSNKRLIHGNICEVLAMRMRPLCSSQSTLAKGRQWMHCNYPYVCKVCLIYCTALYCCLTSSQSNITASQQQQYHFNILTKYHIYNILVRPPKVLHPTLSLDMALMNTGVSEELRSKLTSTISTKIGSKTSLQLAQIVSLSPKKHQQPLLSHQLPQQQSNYSDIGLSTGIFPSIPSSYNPHSNHKPKITPVNDLISEDRMVVPQKDTAVAVLDRILKNARSIEYASVLNRAEKDHIMNALFDLLNIKL